MAGWLAFATTMTWLMYLLPGEETIPYHLVWASFALLYGLNAWSLRSTWLAFWAITLATGIALIKHASNGVIGWEECSEIVLMGVLVALLIWHVRRYQASQQRLAEQHESERSHAEQRELAARFGSHELRTRLTIARGFTDLIRDRTGDPMIAADAEVAIGELDKASALATMLLTLVRVESPSARVPVDLADLVDQVLARWAATADREWSSQLDVRTILADAERLEAALDCLIENAVKFTQPGDRIAIQARGERDAVLLKVVDTGAGMPAGDLDRVAELFCTGSTAGERAGSGLGLAIVRAIVEARGGSLQVESEQGRGTEITMRIPHAYASRQISAHQPLAETEPSHG